jgi:hypothetical protein
VSIGIVVVTVHGNGIEPLRRDEEREFEDFRTGERVGAYGWQSSVAEADSVYGRVAKGIREGGNRLPPRYGHCGE